MDIKSITVKYSKEQIEFLRNNREIMEEVNAYLTTDIIIDLAVQIRDLEMDNIAEYYSSDIARIELDAKIDKDGAVSISIDSIDVI